MWQEGVHPQALEGEKMIEQKLEYLHQNPVHRGFVVGAEHWRYSSAHQWLEGGHPLFMCDGWEEEAGGAMKLRGQVRSQMKFGNEKARGRYGGNTPSGVSWR